MSASASVANAIIKVFRGGGQGTDLAAPAQVWAQPHIGDPGSVGTSNLAGERNRQWVTLNAPSSGTATIGSTPTWTNVASSETWTHLSFHTSSNSSLGYCIGSGPITPDSLAVVAGQSWQLTGLTMRVQ